MIYARSPYPKPAGAPVEQSVARRSERASCPCGEPLWFDVDAIGRSVEMCTDRSCPNAKPHAPGTLNRHERL